MDSILATYLNLDWQGIIRHFIGNWLRGDQQEFGI